MVRKELRKTIHSRELEPNEPYYKDTSITQLNVNAFLTTSKTQKSHKTQEISIHLV